ncbi:MAG: SAM-dependent methyltransferase [Parvularcula sp.]|jgi:protein-L-isoaspartate O-methyltransferase|nr:SAM-dependent methyltransferase [Parvularcula sp.]
MTSAIDIDGFEARYRSEADPWEVFSKQDELAKCEAVIAAAKRGDTTDILELGSGIGGHSAALCAIAKRLDCIEATPTGVARTRERLAGCTNAKVYQKTLPTKLPRSLYSTIIISELLYYLSVPDMAEVASSVIAALPPDGQLILAHHWAHFEDAQQDGANIHQDFVRCTGAIEFTSELVCQTSQWRVERFAKLR